MSEYEAGKSSKRLEVTEATAQASKELDKALELVLGAVKAVGKTDARGRQALRECESELKKGKRVIKLLREEAALQTLGVAAGIQNIQSYLGNLRTDIHALGKTCDPSNLTKSLGTLRNARKDLISQIRRTAVGLEGDNDGSKLINAKVVNSTDQSVRKVLGSNCGLTVITAFVAGLGREPGDDGWIRLSEAEYKEFTLQQARVDDPELQALDSDARIRIISNCVAMDQSLSILGPVGVDIWKNMNLVKIDNVMSRDSATVVAYATPMDLAVKIIESRERYLIATAAVEKRQD